MRRVCPPYLSASLSLSPLGNESSENSLRCEKTIIVHIGVLVLFSGIGDGDFPIHLGVDVVADFYISPIVRLPEAVSTIEIQ